MSTPKSLFYQSWLESIPGYISPDSVLVLAEETEEFGVLDGSMEGFPEFDELCAKLCAEDKNNQYDLTLEPINIKVRSESFNSCSSTDTLSTTGTVGSTAAAGSIHIQPIPVAASLTSNTTLNYTLKQTARPFGCRFRGCRSTFELRNQRKEQQSRKRWRIRRSNRRNVLCMMVKQNLLHIHIIYIYLKYR